MASTPSPTQAVAAHPLIWKIKARKHPGTGNPSANNRSEQSTSEKEYYMYISKHIYLLPVNYAQNGPRDMPQDIMAFRGCRDRIELERIKEGNESTQSQHQQIQDDVERLGEVTEDKVSNYLADSHTVWVKGYVVGSMSRTMPIPRWNRRILLKADNDEERDQIRLLLQLRFAPMNFLRNAACQAYTQSDRPASAQYTQQLRRLMRPAATTQNQSISSAGNPTDLKKGLRVLVPGGSILSRATELEGGIFALMVESFSTGTAIMDHLDKKRNELISYELRKWMNRLASCGSKTWEYLPLLCSEQSVSDETVRDVLNCCLDCWESLKLAEFLLLKGETCKPYRIKEAAKTLREEYNELDGFERVLRMETLERRLHALEEQGQPGEGNLNLGSKNIQEGCPFYETILGKMTYRAEPFEGIPRVCVYGEGGSGKTTTCIYALKEYKATSQCFGMFRIEIGQHPSYEYLIREIANVLRFCKAPNKAQAISDICNGDDTTVNDLKAAVNLAKDFFEDKNIVLLLDNAWDKEYLEELRHIASSTDSCVVCTMRDQGLAEDFAQREDDIVKIDKLIGNDLQDDVLEDAAVHIFKAHYMVDMQQNGITEDMVKQKLRATNGLPITITMIARLARENRQYLETGQQDITENLLSMGHDEMIEECLSFLEEGERGIKKRFASLCVLDHPFNCVNKHVLSFLWKIPLDDAHRTARKLASLSIVTYEVPETGTTTEGESLPAVTLQNTHALYSQKLCEDEYEDSLKKSHESFLQGLMSLPDEGDSIDADNVNFVERSKNLLQLGSDEEKMAGRYVVSNLVRHLQKSVTPDNCDRRLRTLGRVLLDLDWLFLWQDVETWAYVCHRYATIRDALPWESLSDQIPTLELEAATSELETVIELGRAGQIVSHVPQRWDKEKEKEAVVEMYFRLYAGWKEETNDLFRRKLQDALEKLCKMAKRWWLRPMAAYRDPPVKDPRLLTAFAGPKPVVGCVLIGSTFHAVMTVSDDGVVRLYNQFGMMIASQALGFESKVVICLGRPGGDTTTTGGDTEHRMFAVSHSGALVRLNFSLSASTACQAELPTPECVHMEGTRLEAVACSDNALVIASGSEDGQVLLWNLTSHESPPKVGAPVRIGEHEERVGCVAVSSKGSKVMSGSDDGTCCIWNVNGASLDNALVLPRVEPVDDPKRIEPVRSCAFVCDGNKAIVCYKSGTVKLWDLTNPPNGPHYRIVIQPDPEVISLAVICSTSAGAADTDEEIVVGKDRGTAHIVRLSDPTEWKVQLGRDDNDNVHDVSASRGDQPILVCAHRSKQVKVWDADRAAPLNAVDADTGAPPQRPRHSNGVGTVRASRCGRFVASGGEDGTVRCWEASTGEQKWEIDCRSTVRCVCMSADGRYIAFGCANGLVGVLKTEFGDSVGQWTHNNQVVCVYVDELNSDDGYVWSGHANGDMVAWKLDTSMPAHLVTGPAQQGDVTLAAQAGGRRACSLDANNRMTWIEIDNVGNLTRSIIRSPHAATVSFDQGFVIGGAYKRNQARARHTRTGRVFDFSASSHACTSHTVAVKVELPDRSNTVTLTANFDSPIQAMDASLIEDTDEGPSFGQVVCGLQDGSVCVLRQPLAEGKHLWHPAEPLLQPQANLAVVHQPAVEPAMVLQEVTTSSA